MLDLNIPQYPQMLSAFKPADYSAWSVAAAAGFTYIYTGQTTGGTGSVGMEKVIEIAITYSLEGKLHTIDVTDPYNPQKMGVAADGQGNDLSIIATDIAINKDKGLAYVSSGVGVYVIDIKDPYHRNLSIL